jgi:predicted GNAT family acetyltransferase
MDIVHQPEKHRFVVEKDGEEAVLAYRLNGNSIDFTSTYVPESIRKQGIAEQLVRHGIAWAKSQSFNMNASCWYAAKFIR